MASFASVWISTNVDALSLSIGIISKVEGHVVSPQHRAAVVVSCVDKNVGAWHSGRLNERIAGVGNCYHNACIKMLWLLM